MTKYFFLFFLSLQFLFAQIRIIKGKTINSQDSSMIPFVSISVKNTQKGTLSDEKGQFSLKIRNQNDTLVFSNISFERKMISVNDFLTNGEIITLKQISSNLNEVIVRPKENPAWEIIRRVLENKEQNDPDKLDSYRANVYSKIDITIENFKIKIKKDSLNSSKTIKSATFYVQENYSEIIAKKPAKKKEKIIASIGNFPVTYTYLINTFPLDINPFGFYKPLYNNTILKRFYVNPINEQTFKQYDFELQDTLINEADSTFIITYKPYKSMNFEGLTGILQINSNGFAIENITAKPADTLQYSTFNIKQSYERVFEKWFPTKSEINILGNYDQKNLDGVGSLKLLNIYENIRINEQLANKLFDESNREMSPNATVISQEQFKKYRLDSLNKMENIAYGIRKQKKTGELMRLDSIANPTLMGLMSGALEFGKIELLSNYFLRTDNSYEKIRIGIGIQNNQRLKPKFRMMGGIGYGIFDKKLKYKSKISWHITPDRYNRLSIYYENDYNTPAYNRFLQPNFLVEKNISIPYSLRDSIPIRIDNYKNYGISLHFKPFPYTWWKLSLENETRNPQYLYQFKEKSTFRTTELKLDVRFAYKEILNRIGRLESIINRWFPIIWVQIVKGIPTFQGNYSYWKATTAMEYQIRFKRMGNTRINLTGGFAEGEIPYPFLFGAAGGRGTFSLGSNDNSTTFETLPFGAYLSDKFISLNVKHNFGRTLIRPRNKYIQPSIAIFNNAIYGELSNPNLHQGINFLTFNNGYFEAGIEIKDLVRVPIKKVFIGSGLGVAYHYGQTSSTNIKNNFRVYWLGVLPSF